MENARSQAIGTVGISGRSIVIFGRALGLSETQIKLFSTLESLRSGLDGARGTTQDLSSPISCINFGRLSSESPVVTGFMA
mgnify:CR=1 FL=1